MPKGKKLFKQQEEGWNGSVDQLLTLQDAELRLLENVRRAVTLRVKCDRDYAQALSSLCLQQQRHHPTTGGSHLATAKVWSTLAEATEELTRLIKKNADFMANQTLASINNLISEKQVLRKLYADEHSRLQGELLRIEEGVNKIRASYEKYLELEKSARAKLEQARGKDQEESAQKRLDKVVQKMHLLHNDYILLLQEGSSYERDLYSTLLPSLSLYHNAALQASLLPWKEILSEYVKLTDFTSENFVSVNERIRAAVKSLDLEEESKSTLPERQNRAPKLIFPEPISKLPGGEIMPESLVLDSSTYECLKEKAQDIHDQLVMCQCQIKEKNMDITFAKKEVSTVSKLKGATAMLANKKRGLEILSKELRELQCKELRLQEQSSLVKSALALVGPDGPQPMMNTPVQLEMTPSLLSSSNPHLKGSLQSFQTTLTGASSLTTGLADDCDGLQEEDWFHGVLPREEVVRLLVQEGDFLVRQSIKGEQPQTVISVRWHGAHRHFILQITPEGHYRLEGPAFPTVAALVDFLRCTSQPLTASSGAVLLRPVPREVWELNNDDVILIERIGKGNFGEVYRGRLRTTTQDVAVKICQLNLPDEHKKRFLREGRILKHYEHPNIVKLIGICVQKQPIMIVMELVPGGSLLKFLRANGPHLTQHELLTLCLDAAAGMEYLESKNCIHRDLAARNCLVGRDNVVKISDFGMSREEEEYTVSDGMKQIPIKWTAPEALNYGKYTSLCDVWSFGVLMWEIFSLGGTPYSGLPNAKAREMIDSGYRLPSPEHTPAPVYELMLQCWEYEPDRRPNFRSIHSSLKCMEASYRK